jgi:hypothetical protein
MRNPVNRGERQVRLKPQYAHLYRGIPPNEWWPGWLMAEQLLTRAEGQGLSEQQRICDPSHFMFRGGQGREPRFSGSADPSFRRQTLKGHQGRT